MYEFLSIISSRLWKSLHQSLFFYAVLAAVLHGLSFAAQSFKVLCKCAYCSGYSIIFDQSLYDIRRDGCGSDPIGTEFQYLL